MVTKKTSKRYQNIDTPLCTISEPILRNILTKWQAKWEEKYRVRVNKKEKVSWALSVLGIDFTLWIACYTTEFKFEDPKTRIFANALLFFCAVALAVALAVIIIQAIMAFCKKEDTLDIEDLIKDIEKRTE